MRLRQEQVVFWLALALVGLLFYRSGSTSSRASRSRSNADAELPEFAIPDVARALPPTGAGVPVGRELFAPPRDTRPLPLLEFEPPPRIRPALLVPPSVPGPQPELFAGYLLGRPLVLEAPNLFGADAEDDVEAGASGLTVGVFDDALVGDPDLELGGSDAAGDEPGSVETALDRAARIEGYKSVYDWIRLNEFSYLFGRIENDERYGLLELDRQSEPVQFVQLNPEDGTETYPGQLAIAYERERVTSYGFADTVANRIELRWRELGEQLSPANFQKALELGNYCVEHRFEAPRSLALAEDLFTRAAAADPGVYEPRLGLAQCYEAAYDFERAFVIYRELVTDFPNSAAPRVALAGLEERFLLFESAEAHLLEAVRLERGDYVPNLALGRFLAARGRADEALEPLRQADRYAPNEPGQLAVRVAIRIELATALVQRGELTEAARFFGLALRAAPGDARAEAGLLATLWLLDGAGWTNDAAAAQAVGLEGADDALAELATRHSIELPPGMGLSGAGLSGSGADTGGLGLAGPSADGQFELTLMRGLFAARFGALEVARDQWLAAAALDPLRAHAAQRALAWLALATGAPDEALRFIGQAIDTEPNDAWSLYFRGVVLAERDDVEGAAQSFQAALQVELDFEDALLSMGNLLFDVGRHAEAERYLERCCQLAPGRADAFLLRGLNHVVLGDAELAEAAFQTTQRLQPGEPTSLAGLAFGLYAGGDPEQAQVQLRNLDDIRRDSGEDDPWRLWAQAQIKRISEHLEKVAWTDGFERREIRNGWVLEQRVGPSIELEGGVVSIAGTFTANGETRLFREYKAGLFVSFEGHVRIQGDGSARIGLFLARERERRGESEVVARAAIARHKDGETQVELRRTGQTEDEAWVDLTGIAFEAGRWVRVRVELGSDGQSAPITLYLDGIPVVERQVLPGIGQSSSILRVGLFAEGDVGRSVKLEFDDVEVVYRK